MIHLMPSDKPIGLLLSPCPAVTQNHPVHSEDDLKANRSREKRAWQIDRKCEPSPPSARAGIPSLLHRIIRLL